MIFAKIWIVLVLLIFPSDCCFHFHQDQQATQVKINTTKESIARCSPKLRNYDFTTPSLIIHTNFTADQSSTAADIVGELQINDTNVYVLSYYNPNSRIRTIIFMNIYGSIVKNFEVPKELSQVGIFKDYIILAENNYYYNYAILGAYDSDMKFLGNTRVYGLFDSIVSFIFDDKLDRLYIATSFVLRIYSFELKNGVFDLKLINEISNIGFFNDRLRLVKNGLISLRRGFFYLIDIQTLTYKEIRPVFCKSNWVEVDCLGNVIFKCKDSEYGIIETWNDNVETIDIIPNNTVTDLYNGIVYLDSKGRLMFIPQSNSYQIFIFE